MFHRSVIVFNMLKLKLALRHKYETPDHHYNTFVQENAFQSVVCEPLAIYLPQYVKENLT